MKYNRGDAKYIYLVWWFVCPPCMHHKSCYVFGSCERLVLSSDFSIRSIEGR